MTATDFDDRDLDSSLATFYSATRPSYSLEIAILDTKSFPPSAPSRRFNRKSAACTEEELVREVRKTLEASEMAAV